MTQRGETASNCTRGSLGLILGKISSLNGCSDTGNRMSRVMVGSPSLQVFKRHVGVVLGDVIWWQPQRVKQLDLMILEVFPVLTLIIPWFYEYMNCKVPGSLHVSCATKKKSDFFDSVLGYILILNQLEWKEKKCPCFKWAFR